MSAECVYVSPGNRNDAKGAGRAATTNAEVNRPQIPQCLRKWRHCQLLFKLRAPLIARPGKKSLQGFPQGEAFLVTGGKLEFALRVLYQLVSERGVKELSAARNSMAWVRRPARFGLISSL